MRYKLVVSDIDGTLVNSSKKLAPETIEVAHALQACHIPLCLVSSRPPKGMQMFLELLGLSTPVAGCNGGLIMDQSGKVIVQYSLSTSIAQKITDHLGHLGIDVWFFSQNTWYIQESNHLYVEEEARVLSMSPVRLSPEKMAGLSVEKIMGVSNDPALLEKAKQDLSESFVGQVSLAHSTAHYLDITHPLATKGQALFHLADTFGVSTEETFCIGDMDNDISMFLVAGCSVAMGNASLNVRTQADFVTGSNEKTGWADAVKQYVLAAR